MVEKKRGDIQRVVDEYENTIFADMITYRVLRYRSDLEAKGSPAFKNNKENNNNNDDNDGEKENEETNDHVSEIDDEDNNNNNMMIRTPNKTKAADYHHILNIITGLYHEQYIIYNDNNQHVPKGTFDEIINRVYAEHGTPKKAITMKKVWDRMHNGNIQHSQRLSPIHDKESDIVEMIEALANYDRPISKKT